MKKIRLSWTSAAIILTLSSVIIFGLSSEILQHSAYTIVNSSGDVIQSNAIAATSEERELKTQIGVNLTSVTWYANERAFSNLVLGGFWQFASPAKGWSNLEGPFVNVEGNLVAIPPGGDAVRMLNRPATATNGSLIRCTYVGKANLTARGAVTEVVTRPGQVIFRWANAWKNSNVWLQVHSIDSMAPLSQLDCRETGAQRDARFDPNFVESLKGYAVLRFMDWERTNANAPARWAERHTPASIDITTGSGVAIEDIVSLSNIVHASPWVTIPWNADEAYITHFAQLLHDNVQTNLPIYIEVSNEVWNTGFSVSRQALMEGQTRGLGRNPRETQMQRYAQRTIEVMRIWERVFADDPKRLVRIIATQHVVPAAAEIVLSYPGLAEHVDALATAPYFGFDLQAAGATRDLSEVFRRLDTAAEIAVTQAQANKAVASRHGKRYLAYEAGQHVILPGDLPLLEQIERDPRMYQTYRQYINAWRAKVGDVLMLYASTGSIGPGGAWGLSEHSGQSPTDAPKLRASIEARTAIQGNSR